MQQLIKLINQNIDLNNDMNIFLLILISFGFLIGLLSLLTVIKEKIF